MPKMKGINMKIAKYTKIIAIIIIILYSCILSTSVYAMPNPDQLHGQGSEFINRGQAASKISPNEIAEIVKPFASLLLGIGTVVIIAVAGIMGVKYVTSSPDVQAKLKTQLIGLVVSIVVLYGAYGIWAIAYRLLTDITA